MYWGGGTVEIQWKAQKQVLKKTKTQKGDSSQHDYHKHEKDIWNYTMHVLLASLQLYCVMYV